MKTEFQAKFLMHLSQRKTEDKGFTLIELLVVIIIIGILAAIALPAFLNQANKAKQSEGKQYVGTLMRTQQAYYLENAKFTSDHDLIGRPVASQTENYLYTMAVANPGATNEMVNIHGQSLKAALKPYVGATALSKVTATSEATTTSKLCESKEPKTGKAADIAYANPLACPGDTIDVGK